LLGVGEILALEFFVFRGLPLPSIADLDEMLTGPFELVRGEFTSLLKYVLLRRGAPLLADLLHQVVCKILTPVPHSYK
jgi:hypothetical protein